MAIQSFKCINCISKNYTPNNKALLVKLQKFITYKIH